VSLDNIKIKLVKDLTVAEYFINKKYKKIGLLKYTTNKVKNFFKSFWDKKTLTYICVSNATAFGYSGSLIGLMSLFSVSNTNPFVLGSFILVVAISFFLAMIEEFEIFLKSLPVASTIMLFLVHYFNTDVESLKYAFYVCAAVMNLPILITLLAIPTATISSLLRMIFNSKSMKDMNANLEIEDHEVVSKILTRGEFSKFLEHYKKQSDIPLEEMKVYIKKLESEKQLLISKEKEEELKMLKKEKLENYADSFYRDKN